MKEKSQNLQKNCALVEQISNNYCASQPKSVGSRIHPKLRPKGSTLARPYRPIRTKGADQKSAEVEAQKKKEYLNDIPFYMPSRMACFSVFRVCRNKVILYISFGHLIKSLCVMVMSLRYRKDTGIFRSTQIFLYVVQHSNRLFC